MMVVVMVEEEGSLSDSILCAACSQWLTFVEAVQAVFYRPCLLASR